ncbi:choline ABC transporter substrate-binding protein [Shinella yambaruensis]|uniref:Glycine/betaine ABC transporter substrate-binding protein n=1 Tax=Shinella yambaruensis TaxID=415996 RepID=A0ABQ5ZFK4_9HYPH|nr:choline ABC transporter substrate-binding protein [Shinella yambaruensis]MCJ8024257.1 choline ABC transporter substrate-binding protein [Shinella yambaruensis]MCU7978594.1 choline ABC transporter substrate-binding protein [Shinella yambaruensis]GLR49554.1 glycine/betaine ABC transporter substrate-binding protein [Shinella yambaruensis]
MNRTALALIVAAGAACLAPAHAALAADAPECKAVRLADLGWTDIALTNTTAEIILGALGYEPSQTMLALNITFDSLRNGDIDVFLGNWRPVQDEDYRVYFDDGSVIPVATNLTGAKYTLAVPKYVFDGGLTSFDDLETFADKLDRKIYGIEPGTNKPLLDMVESKAHGLTGDWEVVESSEAAMLAQVQRAVENREWIVFLGWQPHPMNVNMDMAYLSDGDAEFGPDFGGATVRTLVRKGYPGQCPNVTAFFGNLVFDIDYENAGMNMIMTDGLEARDAAEKMLKAHPEKLEAWLKDVLTFDGRPGLAAVKAELSIQ